MPVDGPVDDLVHRARAWYSIHFDERVQAWHQVVAPAMRPGVEAAYVRARLDGYLRGLIAGLFAPATSRYLRRSIGWEVSSLVMATPGGLQAIWTGLHRALSTDLPPDVRDYLLPEVEQSVTDVIWGFFQRPATSGGSIPDWLFVDESDVLVSAPSDPGAPSDVTTGSGSFVDPDDDWYRTYAATYPYGLLIDDVRTGKSIASSPNIVNLLGQTTDEFNEAAIEEIPGGDVPDDDFDLAIELLAGRLPYVERTTRLRHRDGRLLTFDVLIWVLRNADGSPRYLLQEFRPSREDDDQFWIARDRRFRHLAQLSHDPVLILTTNGTITYGSPATERALGIDPETIVGTRLSQLSHEDDDDAITGFISGLIAADPRSTARLTVRLNRRDGLWRWFELTGANLQDVRGINGITIQARDITEFKELETQLVEQALVDQLTGLRNRRGIELYLSDALMTMEQTGQPLAVLYLDLNGFKAINDRFGHRAGDLVLEQTARRLTGALGPDGLVGRMGGDEFVVIVPGTTVWQANRVALHVVRTLAEPFPDGDETHLISAEVGLVLADRPGLSVETLLVAADAAMYRAKARRDGQPEIGQVDTRSGDRIIRPAIDTR